MFYYLRFLLYNRYPQPHYKLLGADTLVDEMPVYQQGKVYRLRLVGSMDDITTWPEFIVMRTTSRVEQQTTLIEVFMVLLSEYEQFVKSLQRWELNYSTIKSPICSVE